MSDLSGKHLEVFAFDPHGANPDEIKGMAREPIRRRAETDTSTELEFGVKFDSPIITGWVQPYPDADTARVWAARHEDSAHRHNEQVFATAVQRPRFTEPEWTPIPEEGTE
ncbi:hypothetical protein [Nocardia aurea]|uniref:hypothetical protein n=1 Tax=Nocardia aurea TaxID=2144174 RepID=UPI0033B3FB28